MKLKHLFFSLLIVTVIISCEEPIHEEYGLDGTIQNDIDGNGDNTEDTYWPLAIGNEWNYTVTDYSGTYEQTVSVTGTEEIQGNTYFTVQTDILNNGVLNSIEMGVRRYQNVFTLAMQLDLAEFGISSDLFFAHPLKDNMSVGHSWEETVSVHYTGAIDMTVVSDYTYTFLELFDDYDINGTIYNNVAKIETSVEALDQYGQPVTTVGYTYYALNIGNIRTEGTSLDEPSISNITSYTLN